MTEPVITVAGLGKRYVLTHQVRHDTLRDTLSHGARNLFSRWTGGPDRSREDFWALRDVNFTVNRGDVVGIIGRNGAGKSTLLKILSRITEPTEGRLSIRGRVASLLEVGTGFHPELSGRENVFLNGAILGMTRAEIRRKFDEIVAFAEVERFLDTPVKHYSSGMYVRLAFAVAAHLEPEILVVDEVLSVGDAVFQKKCLGKMQAVASGEGRTVLFVSHNTAAVAQLCTSGVLLQQGRLVCQGPVAECLARYAEDVRGNTGRLIDAVSVSDPRLQVHDVRVQGVEDRAIHLPSGTTRISIKIVISISEPLRLSCEIHLREQFGGALAFFSPGHTDPERAVLSLAPGRHELTAELALPALHRGGYTLDLDLTRPGVAYYARAPGLCVLQHEGTAIPGGVVFDQSAHGTGFLLLDGAFTATRPTPPT